MPYRKIARQLLVASCIGRVILAALLLYPPFAGMVAPLSLAGRMRVIDALSAYPVYIALCLLGVAIAVDAVGNTTRTGTPRIKILDRYRVWLYLGASFSVLVAPFSVARLHSLEVSSLYLYLVIFAGLIGYAWAAGVDIHTRGRRE